MAYKTIDAASLETEIGRLDDLGLKDLRARWLDLYGRPAPRFFRRKLLVRAIAHQMRAQVHGGLSETTKQRLREIAAAVRGADVEGARIAPRIKPGTKLIRSHKGVTHIVLVLPEGFEWQGRQYDSLSAIATAISGTRWNGWTFFGLKKPTPTDQHDSRGKFKRPPAGPDGKVVWVKTRRAMARAGAGQREGARV